MLDAALEALNSFLDPSIFVYLFAGVAAGLVIGIIPGLGGTAAVALLLPFIFVLETNQAMALLIGSIAVVHTSDTIASIILGIPGSSSASVLLLDGHPMARQGKAAKALSTAFLSSMAGGLLGAIGLTLTIPIARPLVLSFGAPELFMLTVIGISMTAFLSQANIVRGLLAGAFGVLLGQVGAAPAAADYRFTFNSTFLLDGLDLVAVALAIFGLAEVMSGVARRGAVAQRVEVGSGWAEGARDFIRHWRHVLRGALVGIWTGVLPGLGATATTWIAYGQAKGTAKGKDRKKFGKGDPRGVVAPESGVNSGDAGDLIPTLLFGIPGAAPAAILLGALLTFGIEPGPRMITDNLDTVYTIIWSFVLATVIGAGLAFLLSIPLAKLSFVRFPVLAGGLIVILFLAGFQQSEQLPVLWVMLILGVVGWVMKHTNVPRASFLIGFVLSVPLERYYFLTESLYDFNEWISRPAVLVMFTILVVPVFLLVVRRLRARRDPDVPGGPPGEEDASGPVPPRAWTVGISVAFVVLFAGAFVLALDYSDRARLVPQLVAVVGLLLAAFATWVELREIGRRRGRTDDEVQSWRTERQLVLRTVGWLAAFIVLIYVIGLLLTTVIFVPVFLRVVAGMRWWSITLYTAALVLLLITLSEFAELALPIGYLTPEGLVL